MNSDWLFDKPRSNYWLRGAASIAVFPILADLVEVKTGSRSTAHWRIHFIRPNGWLRHSFAQSITLLDIDGIGQNWEDSNNLASQSPCLAGITQSHCNPL